MTDRSRLYRRRSSRPNTRWKAPDEICKFQINVLQHSSIVCQKIAEKIIKRVKKNRQFIILGNDFLFSGEWWITFFPAIFLVILAFSINLLGDWMRDTLNPKLKK